MSHFFSAAREGKFPWSPRRRTGAKRFVFYRSYFVPSFMSIDYELAHEIGRFRNDIDDVTESFHRPAGGASSLATAGGRLPHCVVKLLKHPDFHSVGDIGRLPCPAPDLNALPRLPGEGTTYQF